MRETVTLGQREQTRARVLMLIAEGITTTGEAAELLGLSMRQVRRLRRAFEQRGPAGLVHGNRGREAAHALDADVRAQVVALGRERVDYNHTHLHELLVEEHGLAVSRRSVSRILTAAGQRSPRRRRARRYHSRRERQAREGMLLQVDGSRHDWLEGRGPYLTLVGAVDDATSELVSAVFREQEDAQGYLWVLRAVAGTRGLPLAWYSDRHVIFRRTDSRWTLGEELAGKREPTQLGQALGQLGVQLIQAQSPQAKGRVERSWGTLQDRLVKELRQARASTVEEANAVLQRYLPRYRKRFAVPAADPRPAYRPVPPGLDLDGVCSLRYVRTVANDNTVRLEERLIQILPGPHGRSYAGCRVEIQERLDGSVVVIHGGQPIATQVAQGPVMLRARRRRRGRELPPDPATRVRSAVPPTSKPVASNTGKPAATHPWRRSLKSPPRTKSQSS